MREWAEGLWEPGVATVGHNCDDDGRGDVNTNTSILGAQSPPSYCHAIIRHSRHLPLQDVAIIRNMTTSI